MLYLPKIVPESLGVVIRKEPLARFMNPGERKVLSALMRSVSANVVIEFGVNDGLTAKEMLRDVPTIQRYVGIDVLPGYVPALPAQRLEVPNDPGKLVVHDKRFELILRKNGSLDLMPSDLPIADVAFIDGDHSDTGVLWDTGLSDAIVRPGGLLIWHDYHDLGTVDVRDVLHNLANLGRTIRHVHNTWIAFEQKAGE